jgi:hypothetical protein
MQFEKSVIFNQRHFDAKFKKHPYTPCINK